MKLEAIRQRLAQSNQEHLKALLPAYLNETLPEHSRRQVEAWLRSSPQARAELETWRKVQQGILSQMTQRPSPAVRSRIMRRVAARPEQVRARSRPARPSLLGGWYNLAGAVLTLFVLALLWLAVQPGVALEWTISGDALASYRIYRSIAGAEDFHLLAEVQAQPGVEHYRYVDAQLLAGKAYVYRLEAVGQSGIPALIRSTASGPLAALPGQLAVLFASLLVGYGLTAFFHWIRTPLSGERLSEERGAPA